MVVGSPGKHYRIVKSTLDRDRRVTARRHFRARGQVHNTYVVKPTVPHVFAELDRHDACFDTILLIEREPLRFRAMLAFQGKQQFVRGEITEAGFDGEKVDGFHLK